MAVFAQILVIGCINNKGCINNNSITVLTNRPIFLPSLYRQKISNHVFLFSYFQICCLQCDKVMYPDVFGFLQSQDFTEYCFRNY